MGPWHIYKLLAEAIWTAFAPLIFAPMWIAVKGTKVPAQPTMPQKMLFFIALANCTKPPIQWEPLHNDVASAICILIYQWIPLVRSKHLLL